MSAATFTPSSVRPGRIRPGPPGPTTASEARPARPALLRAAGAFLGAAVSVVLLGQGSDEEAGVRTGLRHIND
ncbi:hypothetical protein [Streptomyces tsukubensis]|uniref:Uncharacterized protein n=1 Tax=Streptomyces tsukubensis TaxID=83656 RepID=A0A1V4A0G1_9ACTN|nr:hypothetical protein [Streptomyces tsukubensis]OON72307.1 hypothetical protein B1H18_30045 [Streptomyces tsukubensis]QFR94194.1 hypothetical protein GBW32_15440 [Streptomyces tsukubensis]